MTCKEDDIDINCDQKEIEAPCKTPAIMAPLQEENRPSTSTSYNMAVRSEHVMTPLLAIENKENSTGSLVPFQPNFDQDDISDLDLLSAICGVNETKMTTVSNTSNIVTNIPRSIFANCQIGAINITFSNK